MIRRVTVNLGMTVMPEYLQCEGVETVLHNAIDIAGARSITTAPSVMEPASEGGAREPPVDGGPGERRVLDRPLWGRNALNVLTAPSFEPDGTLYSGSPYLPPVATDLTRREGECVKVLLRECRARGVETWLQVMAASPPGVRVQFGGPAEADLAMPPTAAPAVARVDKNGSLASPSIRSFMRALILDLARAYPDATGIKFDWPEYPPYEFQSLWFDYNPAVAPIAHANGIDFERLRTEMSDLMGRYASLSDLGGAATLAALVEELGLVRAIATVPVLARHFELRAIVVADFAAYLAACVRETGKKMFLQGFPPPWNALSGFDLTRLDGVADCLGIKLYTMHWPMIEQNYVDRLVEREMGSRADLSPLVQSALATRAGPPIAYVDLRYPGPDEAHPAADAMIAAKVADARSHIHKSEFWAIGHAYGPLGDVQRRLEAAAEPAGGRLHINRYGYLDEDKLNMLGRMTRAT